jgi:ferritin-like metal-binding protein YciE
MKTKKSSQTGNRGDGLRELFVTELKDMLWAEQHILKALPKMEKAARLDELKSAFAAHIVQTGEHVNRLKEVFEILDAAPRAEKCEAVEGLLKEGADLIEEFKDSPALDAALITAAQKVEHYEIASYGCLRTFAERLGFAEAAELLQETLDEEGATDEKLTGIAESLANDEAVEVM